MLGFAGALAAAACGPASPQELGASSASSADSSPATSSAPPQCPRAGEGGYAIDLSADSGPPGAAVTVSGATPVYAEDGSYVGPVGEIQFWWNADPDHWHDALPGTPDPAPKNRSADVVSLGAVKLSDCTFEFEFEVPDVAPGDYPILPLALDFKDSGAWDSATFHAAYAPVFRVTEDQ